MPAAVATAWNELLFIHTTDGEMITITQFLDVKNDARACVFNPKSVAYGFCVLRAIVAAERVPKSVGTVLKKSNALFVFHYYIHMLHPDFLRI